MYLVWLCITTVLSCFSSRHSAAKTSKKLLQNTSARVLGEGQLWAGGETHHMIPQVAQECPRSIHTDQVVAPTSVSSSSCVFIYLVSVLLETRMDLMGFMSICMNRGSFHYKSEIKIRGKSQESGKHSRPNLKHFCTLSEVLVYLVCSDQENI